jgi:uncharacterized membrane protein (UPF0127 family)
MKRYIASVFVAFACTACMQAKIVPAPRAAVTLPVRSIMLIPTNGKPVPLYVEVANTPTTMANGLMNRTSFGSFDGMLFEFSNSAVRHFWMKQTLMPLEVLFFDENHTLVSMSSMVPCTNDPCPQYSSQYNVQYALEVPVGFAQAYNIRIGAVLHR